MERNTGPSVPTGRKYPRGSPSVFNPCFREFQPPGVILPLPAAQRLFLQPHLRFFSARHCRRGLVSYFLCCSSPPPSPERKPGVGSARHVVAAPQGFKRCRSSLPKDAAQGQGARTAQVVQVATMPCWSGSSDFPPVLFLPSS